MTCPVTAAIAGPLSRDSDPDRSLASLAASAAARRLQHWNAVKEQEPDVVAQQPEDAPPPTLVREPTAAVLEARRIIASNADPRHALFALIKQMPWARPEVIAELHRTRGNAFVVQLLALEREDQPPILTGSPNRDLVNVVEGVVFGLPDPFAVIPGNGAQQEAALPLPDAPMLWQTIEPEMTALATEWNQRETQKLGHVGPHTVENLIPYWRTDFTDTLLDTQVRREDYRPRMLGALRARERQLMATVKDDSLAAQIADARRKARTEWQAQLALATRRYIVLARDEMRWALDVPAGLQRADVVGLPRGVEDEIAPGPGVPLEHGAKPVASSVITFVNAVRQESGLAIVAENYDGHSVANPRMAQGDAAGEYSFDVHPDIPKNADGYYDRERTVRFFMAVERASRATQIAWNAYYNDFDAAQTVNLALGVERIKRSHVGGKFDHGPAPFVLHAHFNIMPCAIAAQWAAGKPQVLERYPALDINPR